MRSRVVLLLVMLLALCWAAPSPVDAHAAPRSPVSFEHLTCEYLKDPLGIDVPSPRFSWQERSDAAGYRQTAYRLLVASSPERLAAGSGDLWDSGWVHSPQTTLIAYHGVTLKSRMRCWWAVQVSDTRGRRSVWSPPAFFSMGLLSPADWRGDWIGKAAKAPEYDLRPLAGARWIWSPSVPQPAVAAPLGAYRFRLTVTVPPDRALKRAVFLGTADNAFRLYVDGEAAGGSDDWYTVTPIDLTARLHVGKNVLAVEARNVGDGGPNPAGFIAALDLEYGDGGRTVIPTGPQWKSSTSPAEDGWTAPGYDDTTWTPAADIGPLGIAPWGNQAALPASIVHPPLPARYLRREFDVLPRPIASATAYVCGLGFFQLFLNGRPATDHIMDPALSDYRKADYYVTMDVTRLLQSGRNAVGVVLGNGRFYAPRIGGSVNTADYGVPRLRMQLEITYADGSRQTIVSDRSWSVTDAGPIRENNEYDGETYDARREMPGWALPEYADTDGRWAPADLLSAPGGVLCAQKIEPMRITAIVHPVAVTSPAPGVALVDMGHTFYGTVRIRASAPRGTTVRMTSAYALLPDGTLKTADNRSAKATDVYTFAGNGRETWSPVFKGQGFRRVQVEGFPGKLTADDLVGLDEHTDVRPVGEFSCSNDLVNRIHEAMRAGMTMFLRSAPLDPDRDERQAWMGDPAKDSESEAYNFDVAAFYTKWMDDVERSQHADGSIPDVAMYWDISACVEWPSVFTIIPDWYTGFYADTRLQQSHYAAMRRWVLAMQRQHGRADGTLEGTGYADWCDTSSMDGKAPDFGSTPRDLVATAYQYHNVRILQHAAARLARTDDVRMWKAMGDTLAAAFLRRFYDPKTGSYSGATQCSYVLPLAFGLLPAESSRRQAIVDHLVHDILVTHDRHLTVGLIGNQWLLQVLSDYGRPDVAWALVTQTTRPSWGYMIQRGSTTIWERWDYDTRDPGMNSEALLIQAGNVDAWFYQALAGIRYDPAHPGFAHILIQPYIPASLNWVRCHFDSPHGRIVSNWSRTGRIVTMSVSIPANTTATVTTPDGIAHELASGTYTLKSRMKPGRR